MTNTTGSGNSILVFEKRIPVLVLSALAGLLMACGDGRVASSEVGNPPSGGTVKGVVAAAVGKPAPNARVTLMPVDFDPVQDFGKPGAPVYLDTTDDSGSYSFSGVDWNKYNLLAVDVKTGNRMLVHSQDVHFDTVTIATEQTLQAPGAISVLLPDSLPFKGGYVYLPGTEVFSRLDAANSESRLLYLDSVPAGVSPAVFYRLSGTSSETGKAYQPVKVANGVKVIPGDTVPALVYQDWANSARVFLNTVGIPVSGPLLDFPVLVRLGAGDLDFSTAASDGHDLRFATKTGKPLSYEIETWDKDSSRAAVWVRLDSIRGNDSAQFFRMYWGNAAATLTDGSKPVFDTAFGYRSVWHMGGFTPGTTQIRDASGYGNTMTAGGGLSTGDLESSPLGRAMRLDGNGRTLTTSKNFETPNTYTISMWFKTTSDSGGKLMGFGEDPGMIDTSRDRHIWMDTTGMVHYGVYTYKVGDKAPIITVLNGKTAYNDGKWHFIQGTLSSAGMYLYIDGEKVDESISITTAQSYKGYWKVGFDFALYDWPNQPKSLYFKGSVDEVRFSQKAFSGDWTRMNWENQRSGSKILRILRN